MVRIVACLACVLFWNTSPASAQLCQTSPVALEILGSGGPLLAEDPGLVPRASASYLVWIDGRGKVLVDLGGGAFLRYAQSTARLQDLSLIAISHFHPDHVSDLPALLWAIPEPLVVAGPSGTEAVPDVQAFLTRLFADKAGAFPMLSGVLGGGGRGFPLQAAVADRVNPQPSTVFDQQGLSVQALRVPHSVPTVAYRLQARNKTIVFGGDQDGSDPRFIDFARGADVLVMHLALGAGARGGRGLHASPSDVGRVAREAQPARLVLSHFGLSPLEPAIAEVRKSYAGPLTVGEDLQCTVVP